MIRGLAFVMLAWPFPACLSEAKGDSAAIAFGQFKSLAGDWEGTYEWDRSPDCSEASREGIGEGMIALSYNA